MKPAPFAYARPTDLREVLDLLQEYGDRARILAGGQSLMAVLNMRLAQPQMLIDINAVEALRTLEVRRDQLCVGAAIRQVELLRYPRLSEIQPLLALAMPWIGHFQTRNRGTVCGSVAHADPSAELPLCLTTLGGSVVLASGRDKRREVPAAEFFQGVLSTARRPDELVVEVRFPQRTADTHYRFREVAMRHGDFALVALAACISPRGIRLGVGGVADRPVLREIPADADLAEALNHLAWSLGAQDDVHASAAYRRQLVRELGRQLIEEQPHARAS